MLVPVIMVVVEGDVHTLEQVCEAVKNGIPVTLIKGSGKAADLIANYIDSESESEHRYFYLHNSMYALVA